MKINDLIRLASSAYPDNFIADQCWDFDERMPISENNGDGLALFIAEELSETNDTYASDKDQLIEAIRVMDRAKEQVADVSFALEKKLDKLNRKKGKS